MSKQSMDSDRALALLTEQLIESIKDLPVDEQIHAVKNALRESPRMIAGDGLTEWISTHKDRIHEMAMNGELNG
jgi:hypothetical protein